MIIPRNIISNENVRTMLRRPDKGNHDFLLSQHRNGYAASVITSDWFHDDRITHASGGSRCLFSRMHNFLNRHGQAASE
jgi:hypothetical protein